MCVSRLARSASPNAAIDRRGWTACARTWAGARSLAGQCEPDRADAAPPAPAHLPRPHGGRGPTGRILIEERLQPAPWVFCRRIDNGLRKAASLGATFAHGPSADQYSEC